MWEFDGPEVPPHLNRTFNSFKHLLPLRFFFSLLSFILSAGWVNSLPVTARWPSSFKSTDKHRPQTGRREVTSYLLCSSLSEAALCQCWVGADYMTVRRPIIKVFAGPAPPLGSQLLHFAVSKCPTGQLFYSLNPKAAEPEIGTYNSSYKLPFPLCINSLSKTYKTLLGFYFSAPPDVLALAGRMSPPRWRPHTTPKHCLQTSLIVRHISSCIQCSAIKKRKKEEEGGTG